MAIRKAIKSSSFFIALLSAHAVGKRGFVQKEIRQALSIADEFPQDQVFVIPVRLDDCEPSFEELSALHRVDLFPNYHDGLRLLRRVLKNDFEQEHGGERRIGIIARLTKDRQYGFIKDETFEKDVFFHYKDFTTRNIDLITAGMWVSYTLRPGPIGSTATEITLS